MKRQTSLSEVATDVSEGRWTFDMALRNWTHQFVADGFPLESLAIEPILLCDKHAQGALYDAFLAATAEHFCAQQLIDAPLWTQKTERFLKSPWFSMKSEKARRLLLVSSPAAFKKHNLFITASALDVA